MEGDILFLLQVLNHYSQNSTKIIPFLAQSEITETIPLFDPTLAAIFLDPHILSIHMQNEIL